MMGNTYLVQYSTSNAVRDIISNLQDNLIELIAKEQGAVVTDDDFDGFDLVYSGHSHDVFCDGDYHKKIWFEQQIGRTVVFQSNCDCDEYNQN